MSEWRKACRVGSKGNKSELFAIAVKDPTYGSTHAEYRDLKKIVQPTFEQRSGRSQAQLIVPAEVVRDGCRDNEVGQVQQLRDGRAGERYFADE
jgi:hypothetical protein